MSRKLSSVLLLVLLFTGMVYTPVSANTEPANSAFGNAQVAPTWWAWAYDSTTDSLSLLNVNGQQMGMARPKLPNEQTGNTYAEISISRDGQYMLISAPLNNGNQGLGIYSFVTQSFLATHDAGAHREIRMGKRNNNFSGYLEELGTQYAAVTFVHDVQSGAPADGSPDWSIMVYELKTGTKVDQLDSNNANLKALIPASSSGMFANIVYMDRNLEIHAQILPAAAGVPTYADTFVWDFDAGAINLSPWTQIDIDLLPNPNGLVTQAIFPAQLSNYTMLPPHGPYDSMNAIQMGKPRSTNPAPTDVWVDGTHHHYLPRWAAGGGLILFGTQDANDMLEWNVMVTGSSHLTPLGTTVGSVSPLPDGFLAQVGDFDFYYYTATTITNPTKIWTSNSNSMNILWTSSVGVSVNYPPGSVVNNNGNPPPSNNNPPPSNGASMSYGDVVPIQPTDCTPQLYTFQGTAGDIVNIYLGRGQGSIDPYLAFSSPSGILLATDDNSNGFPNAWIKDVSLPETGLYEIYASCVSGTGLHYLRLESGFSNLPPRGGGHIAYGETKTGHLLCGQVGDTWYFYGNTGDTVDILMANTDGGVDAYLQFSHDGTGYITEDNDSGGGLDARITYTLTNDGNHVILTGCANSSGGGSYTLSLNAGVVSQNPPSPPTVIHMNYGDVQGAYKDACNFPDYYTFDGTAGDVVDIYMYQSTGNMDPTLALWSPSNQLIAEDDDGGGHPNALLSNIVLPETGTYNINAGCYGSTVGDYGISLSLASNNGGGNNNPPPANNPPPIQNGGTISIGQTVFGEFAVGNCTNFLYFFDANAGDVISFEMWQETGDLDPVIVLYDPNVNEIFRDDDGAGYPNAGLYGVYINETGNYRIGAQCLSGSGRFRLETWYTQ